MNISGYIKKFYSEFPKLRGYGNPWTITSDMVKLITLFLTELPASEFDIKNNIAIHKSATIEENVIIKEYSIIREKSIVKSGAYIRNGVYIGKEVLIGANCEVKQSIIFDKSRIAHLNYVGNSIIGEDVNLEAGAILANHFNERENKRIFVNIENSIIDTNSTKFGSLVGDNSRIGANAVLNPGTILNCNSVVGRLVHIDQITSRKNTK